MKILMGILGFFSLIGYRTRPSCHLDHCVINCSTLEQLMNNSIQCAINSLLMIPVSLGWLQKESDPASLSAAQILSAARVIY